MKASLIDRSNYYRGILVLIGRDRIIDPKEHDLALQFGVALDFEKRFCESAIANLLDNKYINEDPILFEAREIAECFLRDALKLSLVDKEMHARELEWLKEVARTNEFPDGWLENEYKKIRESESAALTAENSEIHKHL